MALLEDIISVQSSASRSIEGAKQRFSRIASVTDMCLDNLEKCLEPLCSEGYDALSIVLIKGGSNLQKFYSELSASGGSYAGNFQVAPIIRMYIYIYINIIAIMLILVVILV